MQEFRNVSDSAEDPPATRFLGTPSRVNLRTSLLLWFLGISLIPLATVSFVGYKKALDTRCADVHARLFSTADAQVITLRRYLDDRIRLLESQSRSVASGTPVADLNRQTDTRDLADVVLVDPGARALFSATGSVEVGADLTRAETGSAQLAAAFQEAVHSHDTIVLAPSTNSAATDPRLVLAHSIQGPGQEPGGVLLFTISLASVVRAAQTEGMIGLPHRTLFLVDDQVLAVSHGKDVGAGIEAIAALDPSSLEALRSRVAPTGAVARGGFSESFSSPLVQYRDSGGHQVFGVFRPLRTHGLELGIVTEVARRDSLAAIENLRIWMVLLLAAVSLIVVLAGLLVSQRIAEPIASLGRSMQRVADGHRVQDISITGPNEVGRLAQQFGFMLAALNVAQRGSERQYQMQRCQFELNEKMRGEPNLQQLAASVLDYTAEYYGAQVGVFYLAQPGGRLELAARVGLQESAEVARELRIGQGLIGNVAADGICRILRDLPPDHLPIETGLGRSRPGSLIVAPFLLEREVKGVLELGMIGDVATDALEFLAISSESVALALESARSRGHVAKLLEETREQAGVLARQQRELQVTNARLARSDRYKNEFLANMSHELRTPLNSMLIMSQVLAENTGKNLNVDEVVAAETIHKAGRDLLAIIDDILDLSRVEAGKLEINSEDIDIGDFLVKLEALFRPMATEMQLDFQVHIDPDLPDRFRCDPGRVSQILNNLLGNGLKFTEHGSVVLRAYRPEPNEMAGLLDAASENWIAFAVTDTGIGMSSEQIAHVFDAFNQADGSIGRRFGGSGLGLSISRKLADLLGGQVRAESRQGEGSTFTLYLPLTYVPASNQNVREVQEWNASAAAPAAGALPVPRVAGINRSPQRIDDAATNPIRQEADAGWGGKRILICSNTMRTLFRLTSRLEALGARTLTARDWSEVELALKKSPDLALVDVEGLGDGPADCWERWNRLAPSVRACALVSAAPREPDSRWSAVVDLSLDENALGDVWEQHNDDIPERIQV